MKTVLLMTDFSGNARNAIKFAIAVFGQEVEYLLLNTFLIPESTSFAPLAMLDYKRQNSKEELAKERVLIRANFPEYPDLKINTICELGMPDQVLERIRTDYPIDLVVMGTKGATGLQKVLVGTVTATVLRETTLPVLVVPENALFTTLDRIVFASDLHKNKNESLLKPLVHIAGRYNSEIMLLNVIEKEGMSDGKVNQHIQELKGSGYLKDLKKTWHIIESADVSAAIDGFCQDSQADLLVLVSRHNQFFNRIFHRSISQQLVYQSNLPILVFEDSFSN